MPRSIKVELTITEASAVLHALADAKAKIVRSKAKSWRPSTKAMAMAELERIGSKVANAMLGLEP